MATLTSLTPASTLQGSWLHCCGAGLFLLLSFGCSNTRDVPVTKAPPGATQNTPKANVHKALQGSFVRVAKRVSGTARFAVTLEGEHQLLLENVEIDASDPIHVYLLARDDAPTTASVEATEDKYDVGELNPAAPLQHFALPSEPDPKLRAVVLWNVRYGVNLAQAQLR